MLKETKEGVFLSVKVIPNSSKEAIVGWQGGHLKIKLVSAPEKGQANRALLSLLATKLKISQKDISIIRGETTQIKIIFLKGKTLSELEIA